MCVIPPIPILECCFANPSCCATRGINNQQAIKIRDRLTLLDTAQSIDDMDIPSLKLHPLKGLKTGLWAITVTGNWRIVFKFIDGNAYVINYEDYH